MTTLPAHKAYLLGRIRRRLQDAGLPEEGGGVVVAVSGGSDSVALLHLLNLLRESLGLSLFVAHLNHGLRSGEADAEQAFVETLAAQLNLPVFSRKIPLQDIHAQQGGNLQSLARRLRYQFLKEAALHYGAHWIATGHTLDDQAETILHALIRGAGRRGLSGILPHRPFDDLQVVRPAIDLSRNTLMDYLNQESIPFCSDSSNLNLKYTRNRLRHEVLPILQKVNPHVVELLARMGEVLADEEDFLEKALQEALAGELPPVALLPEGREVLWQASFSRVSQLHPALQRRLAKFLSLYRAKNEQVPVLNLVGEIMDVFCREAPQWELHLPAGRILMRRYEGLYLLRRCIKPVRESIALPNEGEVGVSSLGGRLLIQRLPVPRNFSEAIQCDAVKKGRKVFLDADRISGRLVLRCRRPGDRMRVLGGGGTRKVKKIMMEANLTFEQRSQPRLLVCGGAILWIMGCTINDNCKVTSKTRRVLSIEFREDDAV